MAAYFNNSAVYFKTFWQPWMLVTGEKAEEANRGGTDIPDTSISDLLYTI